MHNERTRTKRAWLKFKFWDPLHISGMAKATAFKYDVHIDYEDQCQKCKIRGQRGCGLGHVAYLLTLGSL